MQIEIDSNEKENFSENVWKATIIWMSVFFVIGILAWLFEPIFSVVPFGILLFMIISGILQTINMKKFGEVQFFYNKGSVHLGGYLELKMKTTIPYAENIKYECYLENILYRKYKPIGETYSKTVRKVLEEVKYEVFGINENSFITVVAKVPVPKDGEITKDIEEKTFYDKKRYEWKLTIVGEMLDSIDFKRTFQIEVTQKNRKVSKNKKRRNKK